MSLYYDYKFQYKNFKRSLNSPEYDCSVYNEKFEPYFKDHFFDILKRRVPESFINRNDVFKNDFLEVETKFLEFYRSFNNVGTHETYIGADNPQKLLILLKKICSLNDIPPDCVDSASCSAHPGRALFFLELFAQMTYSKVIEKFQAFLFNMDSSEQRKLISSPTLMLVPWKHQ